MFVAAQRGSPTDRRPASPRATTSVQDRVQSYTSIATSPRVTRAVIDKYNLALTTQQLADKITSDAPPNKVLINLHVTDHDPRTARTGERGRGGSSTRSSRHRDSPTPTGKSVVKLTVIHPATMPSVADQAEQGAQHRSRAS